MGRFLRKAKISEDATTMEVASRTLTHDHHHSSLAVCTRSRTLSLQRLPQKPGFSTPTTPTRGDPPSDYCLHLRSRRLEKHSMVASPSIFRTECGVKEATLDSGKAGGGKSSSKRRSRVGEGKEMEGGAEVESCQRNTRESTPHSLILDSDSLETTCSMTRTSKLNAARRNITITCEMEEFFSSAERQQQKNFCENYNFDLVHDCPLPGRYEWVRLDC